MNKVRKESLKALAGAVKGGSRDDAAESFEELTKRFFAASDKAERERLLADFAAKRSELADFIESGRILALTTQVPHEGSDMSIYKVGVRIKEKYEVLEAYDMTMEACLTKLMWISARTDDHSMMRELFYRPVNHDII